LGDAPVGLGREGLDIRGNPTDVEFGDEGRKDHISRCKEKLMVEVISIFHTLSFEVLSSF